MSRSPHSSAQRGATEALVTAQLLNRIAVGPRHICLFAMLSRLVREHELKQKALRDECEKRKREALVNVGTVSSVMMDSVNIGVATVFANQKQLDSETKLLQAQSARFAKQAQDWIALMDKFNQSLKELGDVENWAKIIENDMKQIATSLEYVHRETGRK
eukprot:TRINITY_DN10416_c0_g1_i1.p1 TRINITY_DN10416_c0_g1~~TRINITY_DN10416_c0_g1_i1.p1  ORF type:complete len:160 (+),score=39.09 TRINITY_DN10416_c0_g1_i1:426-905(+)